MRIGVVDLDTSHPETFHPLLAARGHAVVAVLGGETVVDQAYTESYAAEHGIGTVVTDPSEMVGDIDAAFVHSVNWDHHVERIRPFVAAGLPVHVCKPFAGRAADLAQLESWVDQGARITGGSALRWTAVAQQARSVEANAGYAVTFGHPLDYGIHAYSLIHGAFGPGITSARALDDDGRRSQLRWSDGRSAIVDVQPPGEGYGFFLTLVSPAGVEHLDATGHSLYEPFLDVTCAYLGGEEIGLSFAELIEPELSCLAARASARHGGDWVDLRGDSRISDGDFDGAEFAREYARTRRARLGLVPREN
ncbi:hypothetical protein [Georgenia deserti]|uniref:Gfo/Idh/MocA-like oxidoreductase N-terminal domain-containing protein n=1 Tax=Georgenia deserti TaxID=2093781 RepID=A0ABW4L5T5_9MICO